MTRNVLERVRALPAAGDGWFAVALVDALLVAGLLTVGSITHAVSPLAEPLRVLETAAPFVAGWVAVAPVAGCYARGALERVPRAVATTTVAWLAAANVGMLLRASPLFTGSAVWPFPLVITGLGLLLLVAWRVVYAWVAGSVETGDPDRGSFDR